MKNYLKILIIVLVVLIIAGVFLLPNILNNKHEISSDVYPLYKADSLKWSQATPSPMQRLPGYQITATEKTAGMSDAGKFFSFYDSKLKAAGWDHVGDFDADGITGSQVGYKKDNNYIVLSFNLKPGKITSGENEPMQYTCPCDTTYTVFTAK